MNHLNHIWSAAGGGFTLMRQYLHFFFLIRVFLLFGVSSLWAQRPELYVTASPEIVNLPSASTTLLTFDYTIEDFPAGPLNYDNFNWLIEHQTLGSWDGDQWGSTISIIPIANNTHPFFANATISDTTITLEIPNSHFDQDWWGETAGTLAINFQIGYVGDGISVYRGDMIDFVFTPEIELSNSSPTAILVDDAMSSISFSTDYTTPDFGSTPDLSKFYWQIWSENDGYWDGDAWSPLPVQYSIQNSSHPFWSSAGITSTTATLNAPVAHLDEDFWGIEAVKNVTITLLYDFSGIWVGAGYPVTMAKDFIDVTNVSGTDFDIIPGTNGNISFSLDLSEAHPNSGATGTYFWSWQRSDGQYWTGIQWQTEISRDNLSFIGDPFWSGVDLTNDHLTAAFDVPAIADNFWNGLSGINIKFYWFSGGVYYESSDTVDLIFNWLELPAPDAGPLGVANQSRPLVSWSPVTGAEEYSVQAFLPGTFSEIDFSSNIFNAPAGYEVSTSGTDLNLLSLTPGTAYEVYASTKTPGGNWTPIVYLNTLTYQEPVFIYDQAAPQTVDVNFSTLDPVNITLPFTTQNLPAYDAGNLKWRLETTDGSGQGVYYNYVGAGTDSMAWGNLPDYRTVSISNALMPASSDSGSLNLSFDARDLDLMFWKTDGAEGAYSDIDLTISLIYMDFANQIQFTGTPFRVTLQRAGSAPAAPVLSSPAIFTVGNETHAWTSDSQQTFDWADVDGAWTYNATLSGIFFQPLSAITSAGYGTCSDNTVSEFTAMEADISPGGSGCTNLSMTYGQIYTLTLSAENPVGVSPPVTIQVELKPPFTPGALGPVPQGQSRHVPVVESCDNAALFSRTLDEVVTFDPSQIYVYITRTTDSNAYWNGSTWQEEAVWHTMDYGVGFWNALGVTDNGGSGFLDFSLLQSAFPTDFWRILGFGEGGAAYDYGEHQTVLFQFLSDRQPFAEVYYYFDRLKTEPPQPLPGEKCYSTDDTGGNQPAFQWQAAPFADRYHVKLFQVVEGSSIELEAKWVDAPATSVVFDTQLDPTQQYRVDAATEVRGCLSPYDEIYEHFQYINPLPYMSGTSNLKHELLIEEPALDYPEGAHEVATWRVVQVGDDYKLDPLSYRVRIHVPDEGWDYPIHCSDVSYSLRRSIGWLEEGQDPVHHIIRYSHVLGISPPPFYEDEGVGGNIANEGLLSAIFTELMDSMATHTGDACNFSDRKAILQFEYMIIDVNTAEDLLGLAVSELRPMRFDLVGNPMVSLDLGEPDPNTFLITDEAVRLETRYAIDFATESDLSELEFDEVQEDFELYWYIMDDQENKMYWNGSSWTATKTEMSLSHPPTQAIDGHTLVWPSYLQMDMSSGQFNNDQFFGSGINQRDVHVQLVYTQETGCQGGGNYEPRSGEQIIRFFREEAFSVDNILVGAVTPDPVQLPADAPAFPVSFRVDLDLTTTPPDMSLTDQISNFTWSLRRTVDGQPQTWDGAQWQSGETYYPFGNTPGFAGPAWYGKVSFNSDWRDPAIQAGMLVSDLLPLMDESESRSFQIHMQWSDGVTTTQGSGHLNMMITQASPPAETSDWYENTEDFLSDLGVMSRAYAPEHFFLDDQPYHMIGKNLNPARNLSVMSGTMGNNEYAWLHIQRPDGMLFEVLTFVAVFPDQVAALPGYRFEDRAPLLIDPAVIQPSNQWHDDSANVHYRYFTNPSLEGDALDRLVVVVMVPDSQGLLTGKNISLAGTSTYKETRFNWNQSLLATEDADHNRLLTINHLYSPTGVPRHLYSLAFSDLQGRAQETHAVGSHTPPELDASDEPEDPNNPDSIPADHMLISGIVSYDALGREVTAHKGFVKSADVFAQADDRFITINNSNVFWSEDREINGHIYARSDGGSYFNRTVTWYENDARNRVLATMDMGVDFQDEAALHYTRYHYFVTTAPTIAGVALYNLPTVKQDVDATQPANPNPEVVDPTEPLPAMIGTLMINPDGQVLATFTGNDPEAPILTVANPSVALMNAWGLTTVLGGTPNANDWDSQTVYLPGDYSDRIHNENQGHSKQVATLHHYDESGRLLATYPPRACTISNSWNITLSETLAVTYVYDAYDRVKETIEPDAGTTRFVYNDAGLLRFSQDSKQATENLWTENVYDDYDRVVLSKVIFDLQSPDPNTRDSGNPARTGSKTTWRYDIVPEEDSPEGSSNYWPSQAAIESTWPFQDQPAPQWGTAIGQIAQVNGPKTAERFYYDAEGRPVCRVYVYQSIGEPQIMWSVYDSADQVVATWNHNTGVGYTYTYDAWNRLVSIKDLQPGPVRMAIDTLSSATAAANNHQTLALGPLVNAGDNLAGTPLLMAHTHTPTGHPAMTQYGPDGEGFTSYRTYDLRDWLLSNRLEDNGNLYYQSELFYHENADGDPLANASYTGNIAANHETYGNVFQPGDAQVRKIEHSYEYDPTGQLMNATSLWKEPENGTNLYATTQEYIYDRNGNRLREERNGLPDTASTWEHILEHTIDSATNRVRKVDGRVDENSPTYPVINNMLYDELGNVIVLERQAHNTNGRKEILEFSYNDPVHRILPTTIHRRVYVSLLSNATPDFANFLTEHIEYDHNGNRMKRTIYRYNADADPLEPEITHYLPAGTENLAEMDRWGRAKRAHLFAGAERIGYKDGERTALYVKDHLGSTKMTLALSGAGAAPISAAATSSTLSFEGQFADLGASNNHAAAYGGVLLENGYLGEAALFDGIDDYLDMGSPDGITTNVSDLAFNLWLRLDTDLSSITDNVRIFDSGSTNQEGMTLMLNNDGSLSFITNQASSNTSLTTTTGVFPNDGAWHFLALTREGDQTRIMLDAVEVAAGTTSAPADALSNSFKLGARADGAGNFWKGAMDEISLNSAPRSQTELAAAYQAFRNDAVTSPNQLDQGLIGYWPMELDWTDRAGSIAPSAYGGITFANGKFGQGLSLDGTDDYLDMDSPTSLDLTGSDQITLSVWFKTDANGYIMEQLGSGCTAMRLAVNNNKVQFAYSMPGCSTQFLFGTTDVNDGLWHHVAAVLTGSRMRVYVDGVMEGDIAQNGVISSTGDTRIGRDAAGALYFNGLLDEIKIYNRALSDTEILAEAQAGGALADHLEDLKVTTYDASGFQPLDKMENVPYIGYDGPLDYYQVDVQTTVTTKDLIPVDPAKTYQLSGTFRSGGSNASKIYFGLEPYDASQNPIPSYKVGRQGNDATISAVSGTQVTVAQSLSGWDPGTGYAANRLIGIYYDGDTTNLPDHVITNYTSGLSTDPAQGAYNIASGTGITLNGALPAEVASSVIPGVTVIKNHKAGSGYMYAAASNATVPGDWTHYASGDLTGEAWSAGTTTFWQGTAYVKILVLANWGQGDMLEMDNLRLEESLVVPDQNLAARWPMDNNIIDVGETAAHGTLVGGPLFESGLLDKAIHLDGYDDYVDVGIAPGVSSGVNAFTIDTWVRLDGELDGTVPEFRLFENGSYPNGGLIIRVMGDGAVRFSTNHNGTTSQLNLPAGAYPNDHGWHHLAFTYGEGKGTIYLDGVSQGFGAMEAPADTTLPGKIGSHRDGNNYYWDGMVEDFRIHDYALNQQQIEETYQANQATAQMMSTPPTETSLADRMLVMASDTDPYGIQMRELYHQDLDEGEIETHLYTGQEKEHELGLYYYGARYYMPEIGRFLEVDPAREFVNPYSYVGNNPIMAIDPTGMSEEELELILNSISSQVKELVEKSKKYGVEYGSNIYKEKDGYTMPESFEGDHAGVEINPPTNRETYIGDFHTHPSVSTDQIFSFGDIEGMMDDPGGVYFLVTTKSGIAYALEFTDPGKVQWWYDSYDGDVGKTKEKLGEIYGEAEMEYLRKNDSKIEAFVYAAQVIAEKIGATLYSGTFSEKTSSYDLKPLPPRKKLKDK